MIPHGAWVIGWLRRALIGAASFGAGWWLFADTIAHYDPHRDSDPDTIRFTHFGSYQDFELWGDIIAAFEVAHPGARVRQEYVPGWYGRYDTKVRQQILSNTLPDVVLMQMAPFAALADHFAPVDKLVRLDSGWFDPKGLEPTAIAAFLSGGDDASRLRGVPVSGGNLLIYCNVDCFAAAEASRGGEVALPSDDWSMEEFAKTARALTCDFDGDGRYDQFGFWLPRWVYYLPFVWSFGADVMNTDDGRWTLSGEAAVTAFDFYRGLARDDRACPRPSEIPQLIQDIGFVTGKVAMCVNGPWFQPFLDRTQLRDTYVIAPIPRASGGRWTRITWDGLCVPSGVSVDRKRLAWRFVRHCLSRASQARIASTGRALPALRAARPAFDDDGADERRRRFVEALRYSRLQPRTSHFARIDRAIERHLGRFVAAGADHNATTFLAELSRDEDVVASFATSPGDQP